MISNKTKSLEIYLEGMRFRVIRRRLKISYARVYPCIKGMKKELSSIKQERIRAVEINEMHTYVVEKNTLGYGLPLQEYISFIGRSRQNFQARRQQRVCLAFGLAYWRKRQSENVQQKFYYDLIESP